MNLPDPKAFSVQPLDAIAFLKNKVNIPTTRWNDLWQDMHAAGFMVAGAQKSAVLEDFHEAVTAALENGTTLEQFRQDFDRIVAKHGWNYNGSRNWRSKIIYQTNMRAARSAGRWASIQRGKKHRPYIHYTTAGDNRVRPQHRLWHDIVLPVDHPFWDTHYPPNGWSCRCQAESVNERDLKRYGLKVSPDPEINWEERTVKTASGTGIVRVPEGIHTGFAYNVGIAGFGRGTGQMAAAKHGGFTALKAPGALRLTNLDPLPAVAPTQPILRPAASDDELRAMLRDVLGGEEKIFMDPTGAPVRVSQAIAQHIIDKGDQRMQRERFFSLIPEIIQEPQEIWIGFASNNATGKVYLRRRYIRVIRIDKTRVIALVADADGHEWAALTFFQGQMTALNNLRSGLRIWQLISGN